MPVPRPSTICGNSPAIVAIARMVAEPVCRARYQTSANCTNELPNNENACPLQIVKKRAAQEPGVGVDAMAVINHFRRMRIAWLYGYKLR